MSEPILGDIDLFDCFLSTHGDPYVEEVYRRGIFGLFQLSSPAYPKGIIEIAKYYEHIRATLHGVLFLFKTKNTGLLNYKLEHHMIWNPSLVSKELASNVCSEITQALPIKAH